MSNQTESGVVYLLTSPSGKQYVGQTWDYERRMAEYRRGHGHGEIGIAVETHGWDNFAAVKIARGVQTQDALDATEDAFSKLLGTMWPHGYNLQECGYGGKQNEKTKEKIRASLRGKPKSPETRAKISASMSGEKSSCFGKPKSAETRKKMSAAKLGVPKSQEHRDRISESLLGNKNRKGKSPWNKGMRKATATASLL